MSTAESLTRAPDRAPRTMRRRRPRLGSRAIVGGALVTLAAVGSFAAYAGADRAPGHEVLVLKRSVVVGQRLTTDDVRVELADLPDDVRAQTLDDRADIDGAVALGPLGAGELVSRSSVLPPDETATSTNPTFEFALPVEVSRALNGDVVPGELVDVLATYGTTETAYTNVVARRARVIDLSDASGGVGADHLVVVHLALSSADEIMATVHASAVASVTVVRSTRAAEAPGPDRYETSPSAGGGTVGR